MFSPEKPKIMGKTQDNYNPRNVRIRKDRKMNFKGASIQNLVFEDEMQ